MDSRNLIAALIAGSLLYPASGQAQDVAPPGFGVGISGSVISISPKESKREWGGIGNAWVGYTWPSGFQVLGGGGYGGVGATLGEEPVPLEGTTTYSGSLGVGLVYTFGR